MNLWYVFCVSVELHFLGLNTLWARLQTSSHLHWDEETLFLLISCLWVAGFSVFVGTTTSEFSCEHQFLWSWASAFLFICCFCQEYLLSWCQLCCLWNSAKERIQLILCQNGEGKELKESTVRTRGDITHHSIILLHGMFHSHFWVQWKSTVPS